MSTKNKEQKSETTNQNHLKTIITFLSNLPHGYVNGLVSGLSHGYVSGLVSGLPNGYVNGLFDFVRKSIPGFNAENLRISRNF